MPRHTAALSRYALIALVLLIGPVLSACTPAGLAIGAGATVGVAAFEERGVEQAARDKKTEIQIAGNWMGHPAPLSTSLSVTVYENRALLTGRVGSISEMADAIQLAWKAPAVTEVINEIRVEEDGDWLDSAADSWITAQLLSTMTADQSVFAINYSIETVDGVVYLIGMGQTNDEIERVIRHAREIRGVRKVISHVRVKPTENVIQTEQDQG